MVAPFGCYYRALFSTHVVGFVLLALDRVDCYGCNSGKLIPCLHYGSTTVLYRNVVVYLWHTPQAFRENPDCWGV